ncbi:MAG: hypothetical protein EZS28_021574 [Streblomastix strix]|uniref:Uncharacterized protein n=1 Tax=Streblomastix strix TaxID=222440 RepID=A0A5J4VKN2_9EUKA|nr:MAG: hypothetical protein EZS28_021574 [Streblomastix strix]
MQVLLRKNYQKKTRRDYKQLMKLLRIDSGKQCKFHSYKYSPRFRHHYEAESQTLMKKNHNERSKQKDHENIIIIGIKSFTQPITANIIIKLGGTGNKILLANGDTIDKDQLDYEPIENACYSAIAYGIETPTNIPLNAVMFAQKAYAYPICWNGAIPIDCYINPNVLTRNYASLYLQLWTQDFLQDLKVVWLNKSDMFMNEHLAYQIIPPEKPDIIYLLNTAVSNYIPCNVRTVNIEGKLPTERKPTNSISQIKDARFNKLDINNVGFNMDNEDAIIDLIRTQKILNFPMQIIRTQSINFPFRGFVASDGSMQTASNLIRVYIIESNSHFIDVRMHC